MATFRSIIETLVALGDFVVVALLIRAMWKVFRPRPKGELRFSDKYMREILKYVLLILMMNMLWVIMVVLGNS